MKRENEFIPYEESSALKELGFDEPCLAKYQKLSESANYQLQLLQKERNCNRLDVAISAPTFSQSFRWFREKYEINSFISFETIDDSETAYVWNIIKYLPEGKGRKKDTWDFYERIDSFSGMSWYNNYKEAELECLKKLIEIAQKINNEL